MFTAPTNNMRDVRATVSWQSSGNARRRFPVVIHRAGDYEFPDGLVLRSRVSVKRTVRALGHR